MLISSFELLDLLEPRLLAGEERVDCLSVGLGGAGCELLVCLLERGLLLLMPPFRRSLDRGCERFTPLLELLAHIERGRRAFVLLLLQRRHQDPGTSKKYVEGFHPSSEPITTPCPVSMSCVRT